MNKKFFSIYNLFNFKISESSPIQIFVFFVLFIFLAELLIMFLIEYFQFTPIVNAFVDTLLLVAVVSPHLYFLVYKPTLNLLIDLKAEIVERERLKEGSERIEALLNETQQITKTGGWEYDINEKQFTFTNEIFNIIGFDNGSRLNVSKTLKQEDVIKYFSQDDRILVSEEFKNAVNEGSSFDLKVGFVNERGQNLWVRVTGKPFLKDGRIMKVVGILMDITEQIKMDEALKKSEYFFRQSQKAALIGSYQSEFSPNDIWGTSEVCDQIFGMDDNYPKNVEGWTKLLHPDSKDEMIQYVREHVIAQNNMFNREYKIIRQTDGATRWVWGQGNTILDENGKVVGLIGTIQDITDRKEKEQELVESELRHRKLISNISDVIAVIDEMGIVKYISPNIKNIFGWESSEILKQSFLEKINEKNDGEIHSEFNELLSSSKDKILIEFEYICKDGSNVPVELSGFNLLNDSIIKGILVTFRNITERKKTESAIINNQRLGAVGEMTSAVAHDFNNSLQSIYSNIELALLNNEIPDKVRKYLETIKTATKDASTRVSLLQRFGGKRQEGRHLSAVNMNEVIKDVIIQSRPLWKDNLEKIGHSIEIDTNYGKISNIEGDDSELRSVAYNIIKNCVEAMPKGGSINIITKEENETVYVRISDNGIGMNEKTKTRIFQPFFSTKGLEPGRGLGMSGSYSIIHEHKGSIEVVDSQPGKGTIIEIQLPACNSFPETRNSSVFTKSTNPGNVLWVDDDEMIREVLEEMLIELGHSVTMAVSGAEALELLEKRKFDLVITDLGMPGMSGWELADEINSKFKDTQIAVVTGWGSEITDEEMKEHGVSYILTKPVNFVDIENLIGMAIQAVGN